MRPAPAPPVRAYVETLEEAWISVITLHELRYGVARLNDGTRKQGLADSLVQLEANYADRILGVTNIIAGIAAKLRASAEQDGYTLHLADALIAATALSVDAAVATRDRSGFMPTGVDLIDPWAEGA